MTRALLLAALLALSGCTLSTEWRGDPRFVARAIDNELPEWKHGETTSMEVVAELGPPDDIRRLGRELAFLYRFRYLKSRELRIVMYGAQVFRYFLGDELDSVVIITFDQHDKLAHHGQGKYTADGDLVSVLLD